MTGKITALSAARLSAQGVSGTGTLVQVRFKAKSAGETKLVLQNFEFGATTGDLIPAGPHQIRIVVEGQTCHRGRKPGWTGQYSGFDPCRTAIGEKGVRRLGGRSQP